MEKVILKSSYIILKEKQLVIDIYDGILTLENFKGHKLKQATEKDFSPNYNLLSDFTTVEVRMSLQDLQEYASFIKAQGNIVGKRKAAVVTNTPNQLVYATAYDKYIKNDVGQDLITFPTFEDAFEWLGLQDSKEEILALIAKFRQNPLFKWTIKENSSYY